MLGNVQIDQARAFADCLVAGHSACDALEISGITPKLFKAQADFYVYALSDPRFDRVFYIGKGRGGRALHHERDERAGVGSNPLKLEVITRLRLVGMSPTIYILAEGLSEADALRLERQLIVRASSVLTNISLGQHPEEDRLRAMGRRGLAQIKPLCQFLRERPNRLRMDTWQDVVTHLAHVAYTGTV